MSLHFLSSAALCSRKDYFFAFVYTAYLHFFIAEPPIFSTLSLPSVVTQHTCSAARKIRCHLLYKRNGNGRATGSEVTEYLFGKGNYFRRMGILNCAVVFSVL